ncbi:hypothetical protein Tco_0720690, partial [Tanacetum coccineum]
MAQENYVEGCSMQSPPLLEPNGFRFWKARFETYVKSKDINLWQVIQKSDFYYEVEDSETKLMKETPYELLKDDQKKKLGKSNESKMTIYKRVRAILHVAKVTAIEEAKDLAILPLDELIRNLKVYKMVSDNDRVGSKTTKEKVTSLGLKAKITREQTSDDSDSQGGSDKDMDEEEVEAFNLLSRNFCKFFRKVNRFRRENRFSIMVIGSVKAVVVELCKTCDVLTKEVDSLKSNVSELQDEALNFSKFKESNIALDDMLSRKKLSQDKEGLGFSKNDITTSVCLKCDILLDAWIVDSGCTKHMTRNIRLFTSYKASDGGHVVSGSNLKGKVVGGGNITHDSITITNVEHVSGLAFNLIS